MLEELELFRLTFRKREALNIAAASIQEALSLASKLPNYEVGEVLSISATKIKTFV